MLYFSKLRIIFITIFSVLFILIASSNLFKFDDSFFDKKINLGLDLQGGSYLLLEINSDSLVQEKIQSKVIPIKKLLKDNGINYNNFKINKKTLSLSLNDIDKVSQYIVEFFK